MATCDDPGPEAPVLPLPVAGYPSGKAATKLATRQASQNAKYTRQGNPELGRLTGREKEFEELGDLTALYEGLSAKTRQHVNPLADHFQVPTAAPDWTEIFADPKLPLHIDVGCGSGRFVLIRAQRLAGCSAAEVATPDCEVDPETSDAALSTAPSGGKATANVLGMEIRQKLVDRAQAWAARLQLRNCHFIFTNATVSWRSLLDSYPGPIELVSMQFPDPHFKTRHHKRRHVQPRLCREMAETMPTGARIFLQGDVPEAVRWMRDMIEAHSDGAFALAPECQNQAGLSRTEWETKPEAAEGEVDNNKVESPESQLPLGWSADCTAGWLPENPLGVPSEREVYIKPIKTEVFRVMLVRV